MPLKSDAEQILGYMDGVGSQLRLDPARRWWPKWLYRSDHVENTARILNSGELLSRAAAEQRGVIAKDCGSARYVRDLLDEQLRYVRLYFRPRTPTQYVNEGIRPENKISARYEAHMPIPVYMLFSVELLGERGINFTCGRLDRDAEIGGTAEFLMQTNFKDLYHNSGVGPLGASRRGDILNARHAEVLALDSLSLSHVKRIVCRSRPERDTLLALLDSRTRARWIRRVIVDEGSLGLFNRLGTYVRDVTLTPETVRVAFFADAAADWRGPFDVRVECSGGGRMGTCSWSDYWVTSQPITCNLRHPRSSYTVKVTLNGDLAYCGKYQRSGRFDRPF